MSASSRYFSMLRSETMFADKPSASSTYANTPELNAVGNEKDYAVGEHYSTSSTSDVEAIPRSKRSLNKWWTLIATGTGLFSDGYVNNAVGFFNTMVKQIYGAAAYSKSDAMSNISAITFVGTVVGMLFFGFFSDHISRKHGMIISTVIIILFQILLAGAWGIGMPKDPQGMFAQITVYRALLGIGIGGEYPAGSVATAEAAQMLGHGRRNRWFVIFTNFMIDSGYVAAAMVAWLLLYICGVGHQPDSVHGLQTAWRLLYGLGAIPPMLLFWLRLKFQENDQFRMHNLKRTKTPYWLIIRHYGPRLVVVSLIWFLYDFLSYSWGIYSSQIISMVVHDGDLHKTFGWTVLFNVFYIPGSILGAFSADYFGPRMTLLVGTLIQGIVGFIMCAEYKSLVKTTAGFVVAYGCFTALGEFGPGDNIGLIASKTSPSAIRGRYYGIAAAVGKIGAFAGGYAFPAIAKKYGGVDGLSNYKGQTTLLYVSSALCVFSALLALLLPPLTQDAVNEEDYKFRRYLEEHGYDTSHLGDADAPKRAMQ